MGASGDRRWLDLLQVGAPGLGTSAASQELQCEVGIHKVTGPQVRLWGALPVGDVATLLTPAGL